MSRSPTLPWSLCAVIALAVACSERGGSAASAQRAGTAVVASAGSPRAAVAPSASSRESTDAADRATFERVFGFSVTGEAFLSDNLVSNETSYLDAVPVLATQPGGAYLGVGPEQNYSYIAQSRPELAIIVDLRRDNALLHLLYKAAFERSTSRESFLGLLLGRPIEGSTTLAAEADARHVVQAVETHPPDRAWFSTQHQQLVARIRGYGLDLEPQDFDRIRRMHERFFDRQLDLRFELHEASGRRYPTLRSLLEARWDGGRGSFLGSEEDFRFVQSLERQHRVIPVVGDVSQAEPLGKIAAELQSRQLVVRTFYISNVEQYLVGTPAFAGWLRALGELPGDGTGVLVRSYLDQGRRHPAQRAGHRTTTLVHSIPRFLTRARERPYRSYYAVAADPELLARPRTARN